MQTSVVSIVPYPRKGFDAPVHEVRDRGDLSQRVSPFPFKVTWDITHKCNLRCRHCFVVFQDNCESVDSNIEHHQAIAESIITARPFLVSIAGGEPFVVPHIVGLVQQFLRNDIRVILATNGTIDAPQGFRALASSGRVSLQVSLDGADPTNHDLVRGPGTFFRTLSFAKRHSGSFPLVLAVTLTHQVCQEIDKVVQLAREVGASALKLQRFVVTSSVPDPSLAPSSQALELVRRQTVEGAAQSQSPLILHPFDDNPANACAVGLRECTITPAGNISLCGAVLDQCDAYGNVKSQALATLWSEFVSRRPSVNGVRGQCLCSH